MLRVISSFWSDEQGATAIEYALVATMFAITAIIAVSALSDNMVDKYETIDSSISGAIQSAGAGGGGSAGG